MKIRCSEPDCCSREGDDSDQPMFNLDTTFSEEKELVENVKKVEAESFICCYCHSPAEDVPNGPISDSSKSPVQD